MQRAHGRQRLEDDKIERTLKQLDTGFVLSGHASKARTVCPLHWHVKWRLDRRFGAPCGRRLNARVCQGARVAELPAAYPRPTLLTPAPAAASIIRAISP